MPESTTSTCKTVSWLLAVLLFGATALLVWYGDHQRALVAAKEAKIADLTRDLADKKDRIRRIDDLTKEFEQQKQALDDQLQAANQANEGLRGEIQALVEKHAQALATEQEKASATYSTLLGQYEAAGQRIEVLTADVARLQQDIADAAQAHDARVAQLETEQAARLAEVEAAHREQLAAIEESDAAKLQEREQALGAKIADYRNALEESDPEHARRLAELQETIDEQRRIIEEAERSLAAMREEGDHLHAELADSRQVVADRDQALATAGEDLGAANTKLAQEQSARAALERKHELAVAEATARLEKLQQELKATEEAHERTKAEAAAAIQVAEEARRALQSETEGKIAELTDELAARADSLAALKQDHEAEVAALENSLEAAEQELAGARSEIEANRAAATKAQETQHQALDKARSDIDRLQQDLLAAREKAAEQLEHCQRNGQVALNEERGLYNELSVLGARHTGQGILLSLAEDDLRFPVNRTELPAGELPSLDSIAKLLRDYPRLRARIEGHTDSGGRDETNLDLSQKRADAVKQALVDRGVDPERLVAEGIGEERPIADNATSAGRSKNRRVEIYVIDK